MLGFVVAILVGALCIGIGVSNMRGNISTLHSYHKSRVKEEDIPAFGKMVGVGTVIIGSSIAVLGSLSIVALYTERQLFTVIGSVVMGVGLVVGLCISFYAMIKYNHGIF